MRKQVDLLNGPIFPTLTGLALPIMATSLVQMAYNLTDMAWVGRVGSPAVAAVGSAGMYTWLSQGIMMLPKMGGQIKVAHSLGSPLCPGISPAWNFVCSAVFCSGSVLVPATDQFFWIK